MLEPKTSRHTPVVEKVLELTVVLQTHFSGWFLSQGVFLGLPRLVLGVLGVYQFRQSP